MVLASRMMHRREMLGMSRLDLANMIGIDQKQIWRYETAKNDPTGSMIIAIARALDTTADWLLGLTDEIKPVNSGNLTENEQFLLSLYRTKGRESQEKLLEIARLI